MVNIARYLKKHAQSVPQRGVRAAATNAVQEAATFAYSRYAERQDKGTLIWESDAPITVVLDATRFDLWREVVRDYDWIHPEYPEWSVGSCSPEWIGHTFDPAVMPDERVGVVTANPFSMKPADRVEVLANTPLDENPAVDECHYVFNDSWGCDVSDGYLDVTHPDVVTNAAWDAWREWDVDRLVVHYMQPHIPFRARPGWFGERQNLQHFGEPGKAREADHYQDANKELWKMLRDGEVNREEVWSAYCDNLRWGLDSVKRLVDAVDADVLFTADHGNGMGEWGIWSHPPRMQTPQLRRVPWVEVSGQGGAFERVEIAESDVDVGVEAQLEALGYTE